MSLDLGSMRLEVLLENPTQTRDADGGYTETWEELDPAYAFVEFRYIPSAKLERLQASTVITQGARGARMRWHPDVTERTRMTWTDRAGRVKTASVVDIDDVAERGEVLDLVVVEVP
jgi:head-tail adaptor